MGLNVKKARQTDIFKLIFEEFEKQGSDISIIDLSIKLGLNRNTVSRIISNKDISILTFNQVLILIEYLGFNIDIVIEQINYDVVLENRKREKKERLASKI